MIFSFLVVVNEIVVYSFNLSNLRLCRQSMCIIEACRMLFTLYAGMKVCEDYIRGLVLHYW